MNIAQLRQQFSFLREFTDQEVAGYLIAAHGIKPNDPRYSAMEDQLLGYDRTTGQKIKDAGIGLAQGVLGLGQTAGIIGGAAIPGVKAFDNPVVNSLQGAQTYLDQFKSEGLRNEELANQVESDIAMRDARGEDGFGKIVAGVKAQAGNYLARPGTAVQDTVQSLPSLFAGGLAGRAVEGGLGAIGLSARAAARGGVAGGVGAASVLQGGDVAGQTYQEMRNAAPYGRRADGSAKGTGFLGELKRPDGSVSTELSIGVNIDGREVEIPSLVPTLTKQEVDYLLAGGKPTQEIVDKAVAHAQDRMARGLSPFANSGVDYETAARGATEAGVKGGAISLGLSAVPGATTIERSMLRGASGVGRGGVVGALRGFAGETIQEGTEEGYGQYAQNQAVRQVDPSVDPYAGVGAAAVQGAMAAGPLGAFHGRHPSQQPAPAPAPRTETGEIDLTGAAQFGQYDVPAYARRGLDPLNDRSSPYTPPPVLQDQIRSQSLAVQPGTDGQGGIPPFLRNDQNIPPFLRPQRSAADIAGPAIDPVQRTPANFADFYAEQTPNPYDTSNFPSGPGTAPGAGPTLPQPGLAPSARTQAGATDFTTSPGAAPARGNAVDYTAERGRVSKPKEFDTTGLALVEPGQEQAPAKPTKPTVGNVLVALEKANTQLGTKVIRKDGQVSQSSTTAPLRQVLEAKDPLAKMRELYQDGKGARDELLDVWHKELTGKTIAEAKAEPQLNSAGFVPEPLPQVNAQLQALRQGRIKGVVLGTEEAAKVDLKGLKTARATGPDGATAVVVSKDAKAVQTAVARAQEVGLKQAMGEFKGVANPTITSQPQAPAEGAATVQQVDKKTGHVIGEEVVTPKDLPNVKPIEGTTQRVVPVDQPVADRVQHLEAKKPTLAERKITARADGAAAAMDGLGRGANPYKFGTASHKEWVEGHDEVKARAEAAKPNPIAKKLVETVENTKDESLYDESLYALYKLAANGDVTAFNYFHDNGYFNERNQNGNPEQLKPAQRAEMAKLRTRWEVEQGQLRGKKFGATKYDKVGEGETVNIPRRQLVMGAAALLASGRGTAETVLGKAKPLVLTTMNQKVPPAAEKLLRGNGKTNLQGAKALKAALDVIATQGPVEVRALAQKISNLIPENYPVLLTVTDGDYNAHGAVELHPFVHMRLFNGKISNGLRYATVLHESLHLAVAARYRALSTSLVRSNDAKMGVQAPHAAKVMEQFRSVWDEFREMARKEAAGMNDSNGLGLSISEAAGDPDEFFVRSLTDPLLQEWMAKQQYKGKTLWERFKDWVKTSLLGFREEGVKASWLDAALLASDDLLKAMPTDPGDFKRLRAVNNLMSKNDTAFDRTSGSPVKMRGAAFRNRDTGEVVEVGPVHNRYKLPGGYKADLRNWEAGFVNTQGKFYTREEAARATELSDQPLRSEDFDTLAGVSEHTSPNVLFSKVENKAPTKSLAEGARALTATLKAQMKGEELNESLLNMMTLRQIDEQYGKKLPALHDYIDVVLRRSSNASKLAAEADRVALQWQQDVPRNEMKPLAEILLRASNAELQLDNTSAEYLKGLSEEQQREHAELRRKLEALSPAAQQARKEALGILKRQWNYTHEALKKFITLTVADPGLRSARLEDLDSEFGRNHGDYFPLSRFGDRVVIARGAARDGRDIVTFHESAGSVDAEVRRLKDSGVKPDKIIVTMDTEYDPRKVPGTGFVRELHGMIDNIASGDEARQLHQTLQQLYLKSLPELSGAKHMVRRENIEGYSQDALRVFADAVTRGARYASHLEFGPAVHAAMEAAEAQSRSTDKRSAAVVIGRKDGQQPIVKVVGTGTERLAAVEKMAEDGYAVEFFNAHPETVAERLAGALEQASPEELAKYVQQVRDAVKKQDDGVEDLRAAKQLYNYMVRSQKADINPEPGKVVELAGQVGYAWYLGFSPAFWAMNTLQNPMVGIPHLGAKYGIGKSSMEWMRAARWFAQVRIGKRLAKQTEPFSIEWLREQVNSGDLKGINKQELDMLQRLEDRQVLDFTQAMDLSHIGAASNSSWYKAMRLAAAGAHHTEVFNRVSFALAAYRLAMKSNPDMTHEEATRAAERDVAATHFDYSYANKPLWMGKSSPAMRLVFMFQQYRQHMLYWWASTIKDATKGMTPEARSQARKAALFMGTAQLLFAGTMGLPFIGAIGTLANLLSGGDDGEEPFDFERWMREAALGMTGSEKAADLVLKGVFAAMGADISKRIGQQDLLPLLSPGSAKYEQNPDDKTRAYLFDMLGPLGSIALTAARSTEAFASGDYVRGMTQVMPKSVSDILKSYLLATDGLKDKRGQQLATEEAFDGWDVAMQAAGVGSTQASNVREARGAVLDVEHEFKDQTKRLTGALVEAWSRQDAKGVTEAMADIQRYNQNVAKGRYAQRELLITPDSIRSAIVSRQRRAMLLALTGGLADTRQQLLIATRVSGLYDLEGRDARLAGAAPRLDAAGLPSFSVGSED